MPDPILIFFLIGLALFFDFVNGFHDAANAISTVVATRVLSPLGAVLIAAAFNFIGAFIFTTAVAATIGKGIISSGIITPSLIFAALIGAIVWNLVTWRWGLPSSSSHALIGGLIGAAIVSAGFGSLQSAGITKVLLFIFIAPVLGFIGAILFTVLIVKLFMKSRPESVNKYFKKLQLVSSSLYSLGHGTNDSQKTMGIIAALLLSAGMIDHFFVPLWVVLSAYAAIALGTLAGGWRIVKTMGTKITKLRPVDGFCAESAGSIVLLGTAQSGIPVSTTHVIAGSIMGVGATKNVLGVRWGVARKILWAWILTIPVTATIAAVSYVVISFV